MKNIILNPSCSEMAFRLFCSDENAKIAAKKMIELWEENVLETMDISSKDDRKHFAGIKKEVKKWKNDVDNIGLDNTEFDFTCNYPTVFNKLDNMEWKVFTCNNSSEVWEIWEKWLDNNEIRWEYAEYYEGDENENFG